MFQYCHRLLAVLHCVAGLHVQGLHHRILLLWVKYQLWRPGSQVSHQHIVVDSLLLLQELLEELFSNPYSRPCFVSYVLFGGCLPGTLSSGWKKAEIGVVDCFVEGRALRPFSPRFIRDVSCLLLFRSSL